MEGRATVRLASKLQTMRNQIRLLRGELPGICPAGMHHNSNTGNFEIASNLFRRIYHFFFNCRPPVDGLQGVGKMADNGLRLDEGGDFYYKVHTKHTLQIYDKPSYDVLNATFAKPLLPAGISAL